MSLVIKEEKFTDELIDEAKPMLVAHWKELSANQDIPLDPDYDSYKVFAEADHLVVLTARMDGILIGYLAFVLLPNMHYKTSLQAYQDVLFVKQDKRKTMLGVGLSLLRKSEDILSNRGVQVIQHHVKTYKDFSPLLEKLGYTFVEKIYQKRLD